MHSVNLFNSRCIGLQAYKNLCQVDKRSLSTMVIISMSNSVLLFLNTFLNFIIKKRMNLLGDLIFTSVGLQLQPHMYQLSITSHFSLFIAIDAPLSELRSCLPCRRGVTCNERTSGSKPL